MERQLFRCMFRTKLKDKIETACEFDDYIAFGHQDGTISLWKYGPTNPNYVHLQKQFFQILSWKAHNSQIHSLFVWKKVVKESTVPDASTTNDMLPESPENSTFIDTAVKNSNGENDWDFYGVARFSFLVSACADDGVKFWTSEGDLVAHFLPPDNVYGSCLWNPDHLVLGFQGMIEVRRMVIVMLPNNQNDSSTGLGNSADSWNRNYAEVYKFLRSNEDNDDMDDDTDPIRNQNQPIHNHGNRNSNLTFTSKQNSFFKFQIQFQLIQVLHCNFVIDSFATLGNYLYTACADFSIAVWNSKLHCKKILRGHQSTVLSFTQWKDFLVTCSMDKTVRLWHLNDAKVVKVFEGHHGLVSSVCLWRGYLLSASPTISNWSCRMWDFQGNSIPMPVRDRVEKMFLWKDNLVQVYSDNCVACWTVRWPWNVTRLLWIGWMKHTPEECNFAKLPKDLIRTILVALNQENPFPYEIQHVFHGEKQRCKENQPSIPDHISDSCVCM